MERTRKLQRGAFDLVSAAVGLTVLAIAVVGTSSALLYSRQALVNEEHYKVATYLLRGEMEHEMARYQFREEYLNNPASFLNWAHNPSPLDLDNPDDRDAEVKVTPLEISRLYARKVDLIETGPALDYIQLAMKATWKESFVPGSYGGLREQETEGAERSIIMATTFIIRD